MQKANSKMKKGKRTARNAFLARCVCGVGICACLTGHMRAFELTVFRRREEGVARSIARPMHLVIETKTHMPLHHRGM